MYKFLGKPGKMYFLDLETTTMKLNYNCPDSEKNGTGPGSCGGNTIKKKDNYVKQQKDIDNNLEIVDDSKIFKDMKKSEYKTGDKKVPIYINPNFEKPVGKTITLYHETNRKNISSIIENGLDAEISGSVWFLSKKDFDDGLKDGYLHDDTVIAVVPIDEFSIDKNEQGIEIANDIPIKYIKAYLPTLNKK